MVVVQVWMDGWMEGWMDKQKMHQRRCCATSPSPLLTFYDTHPQPLVITMINNNILLGVIAAKYVECIYTSLLGTKSPTTTTHPSPTSQL